MARIRTIKPDTWTDEKIVSLSPLARLLFIGMWNFADDDGRMAYSPITIKLQVLPADSADCSELLGEIRGKEMIHVYSVDGKEYLQIVNFARHQKIDKRSPSKFPTPPGATPKSSESPRVHAPEGKGREGIKEGKGKSTARKRATPIPEGFAVSERVKTWATEKGFDRLDEHLEAFKRKCAAKGYDYLDWDAAFMEAIREDWAKLRGNGKNGQAPAPARAAGIPCGNCGHPITGAWSQSPKGRVCDPCWRGYHDRGEWSEQ